VPVFSNDSRRVMFPATGVDNNGSIDAQVVEVSKPTILTTIAADKAFFSQDLRTWAAVKGGGPDRLYSVTINGREWRVGGASPPVVHFGPNGRRFAIQANAVNVGVTLPNLIIDGNPAPTEHRVEDFVFSPDASSWAYAASIPSDRVRDIVVRDGKVIHSFSPTGHQGRLAFSPDSRHLAYTVAHGPGTWALAVDGEEVPPIYDFIPYDSRIVFDSPSKLHTIAVRNAEVLLVEVDLTD
jgi:hypothetical protein